MSNDRRSPNYRYNYPPANQFNQRSQSGLVGEISNFARQQPLLAMAGALVGGFLLARYWSNQQSPRRSQQEQGGYRPIWSYAPDRPTVGYGPQRPQPPRPADHMGATEDQMSNRMATPSQRELEEGAKGTTGSVYELDPDSITAG